MRADFFYALRSVVRRPAHAALVVFTLALGLGVNAVAFSVVNALVFRPFAVTGSETYGWAFISTSGDPFANVSTETWRTVSRASTLEAVAAEGRLVLTGATGNGPEQVWALAVSPNYFELVQAPLREGRRLTPADVPTAGIPVMISERFWKSRQGASEGLATFPLTLNGQRVSVVGVVRDDHQGPGGLYEPQVWFTFDAMPSLELSDDEEQNREWLTMIARPAAGASRAQIDAELRAIATAQATDADPDRVHASYVPITDGHPEARMIGQGAVLGLAAVGLVVVIACFNVAGLILARSSERQQELAVRAALGASRLRLTRLLLAEGLLLAAMAGVTALLVASWSEALLGSLSLPAPIPQRLHFAVDWRLVVFTCAWVLVAATVPTITPAWRISRIDPIRWLKSAASGSTGAGGPVTARRWFVRLQVVGSTTFLTLAMMFVASYISGQQTNPGFDTANTAVLQFANAMSTMPEERRAAHLENFMQRLNARPEIAGAALAQRISFHVGDPGIRRIAASARDCGTGDCVTASSAAVSERFFETLAIGLRAGRTFETPASRDTGSVVINAAAAEALWPGENAVGHWVYDAQTSRPHQVIGVVDTVITGSMNERPRPYVYFPLEPAHLQQALTLVARSPAGAEVAARTLREVWQDADRTLPPADVQTMETRMALPLWPSRVAAAFFATCGTIAVVLVTVGLFGVTWQVVSQRTREFGIRLALGATADDLRRLVLGESMKLITPALLVGLVVAAGAAMFSRAMLVGTSPLDPRLYLAALVAQVLMALLASWTPAARAARVSPQSTLKGE